MKKTSSSNYNVLISATLSSFLIPLSLSAVNVALPKMGKELIMTSSELSWTANSYLLTSATFLLPFGNMADIFGRKRVFLFGMLLFTTISLFLSLSDSSTSIIIFRALQGIGGAMVFGTAVALLASVYEENRGKVLGINAASIYLGLSLGPLVGGIITENFGWRYVFAIKVPIGIIVLLFTLFSVKEEWYGKKDEQFDFAGATLYSLALFLSMLGLSRIPRIEGFLLISGGMVLFFVFGYRKRIGKYQFFPTEMITKNKTFLYSSLAALIHYGSTYGLSFLLSLFFQHIKAFSADKTGLILIFQSVVQSILSPFAGKLSDKIEPRVISSLGMGLTAIGIFFLSLCGPSTPVIWILLYLAFVGIGFAFFISPNTNAIISSVDKRRYGVASSVVATTRLVGQSISMSLIMIVFSIKIGERPIDQVVYLQFMQSYKAILVAYFLMCVLGIYISIKRGRLRTL
ncbi:MAG: MFS transporter [Deltaproteobacteria bacterium]|nr:MFS transporter [Deltaproteobacteria bacterium]